MASRLAVTPLEARDVPATLVAGTDYDQDYVLVKWTDGEFHRSSVGRTAEPLGDGTYRVALNGVVSVPAAVEYFTGRRGVEFVQPDYKVTVARTPDDPSYTSEWGLNNSTTTTADIGAPEAWNTGTGTGQTIVAVIDSGIDYNHPDLKANMWVNTREVAGNGKDDDGNGYKDDVYGYDFVNRDANPMDDNGHGTHVAGTIGAVGNNGVGVAGVAWKTRMMALKFLDEDGTGYMSDAVKALNYAVANGAKIVNNSWGDNSADPAMEAAIANARAKGVIFVAAAGNDGTNNDTSAAYPANYAGNNVVAVAGTDRNDRLASFSNYGRTTVDIAAPGQGIYSTLPKNKYGTYSGTSMAAPHVTGALALVWDAHPNWTYRQVIDAVLNTADRVSTLSGKVATGRLNVAKAITYSSASTPGDTAGPTVSSATFTTAGGSLTKARVTFSEAIAPASFTTADVTLKGPGGKAIALSAITAVSGSGQKQFDVTFRSQGTTGTYTLTVGPEITDAAGNRMASAHTTTTTLAAAGTSPKTNASTDAGKWIQDYATVVSTITVADAVTIRDLTVTLDITHTYTKDLRIWLVGPDGTSVKLVGARGGSGNNFTGTVFSDSATTGVAQAAAPFAGTFKPETSLAAFDGKSSKGTWRLVVEDTSRYDTGRLNGWSLTVKP
jgi:serine protease